MTTSNNKKAAYFYAEEIGNFCYGGGTCMQAPCMLIVGGLNHCCFWDSSVHLKVTQCARTARDWCIRW